MSPRGRRILWALIGAGVLGRVVLAFATVGIGYDIEAFRLAAEELQGPAPFSLYESLNGDIVRWAYPSGGFPFFVLADLATVDGLLPFHGLVQLPGIAADAALAWIVQAYLGDRGASERTRLIAAGLVAFGPSFVVVSGYEGQLDTLAFMPAAAALLCWGRLPEGRRALVAGVLIGLGASVKTLPLLAVLALLPQVASRREALQLLGCAGGVFLLTMAPWLLATPKDTIDALRYSGIPGIGGVSLMAQPELAEARLETTAFPPLTGLSETLQDVRFLLLAGALVAVSVLFWRRRPPAAEAALILWLAVFAASVNFGPRYLVWGLPFALMAGRLREAALIQVIGAPAAFLIARRWEPDWISSLYLCLGAVLLAALWVWLVRELRSRGRPAPAPG